LEGVCRTPCIAIDFACQDNIFLLMKILIVVAAEYSALSAQASQTMGTKARRRALSPTEGRYSLVYMNWFPRGYRTREGMKHVKTGGYTSGTGSVHQGDTTVRGRSQSKDQRMHERRCRYATTLAERPPHPVPRRSDQLIEGPTLGKQAITACVFSSFPAFVAALFCRRHYSREALQLSQSHRPTKALGF